MKKTVDWRVNQGRRRMASGFKYGSPRLGQDILSRHGAVLAFHGPYAAVPSASAMRTLVLLVATLVASAGLARGEIKTPQNAPIEITSTGETTYENGFATARGNVAIHLGNADIYADYAQYNSITHDVELRGHVRIYRDTSLYVAESGVYNTETKKIRAINGRTESQPYLLSGANMTSIGDNAYLVRDGTFTTHDSAKPDFHLHARTIRIYEDDRVIFQYVTAYIGNLPVFWWPYLYQSLSDTFSFTVSPAYTSTWGPSILTQVTFPITDNIKGRARFDYFGRRGPAIGFDPVIDYGKDEDSQARIKSFYIQDQNPELNQTNIPRQGVPTGRYRLSLEDRTNFTDEIYGLANLTKLSDPYVMQDFYPGEFRVDPVPDNVIALTKTDPFYTLTGIVRFQANEFFTTTERLPEVVLDIKRHALFGEPIFYESETGFADLRLQFPEGSGFENYGSTRLDTFHQFLYPNPTLANPIDFGGDTFRTVFDTGVEASFKVSRTWENVQSRAFGLDGLLHVIQPFTNF